MTAEDKYRECFKRAFFLDDSVEVASLAYQEHPSWDSVGHMALISELETAFGISIDMDDVIDFESYSVGKELLQKYGLDF